MCLSLTLLLAFLGGGFSAEQTERERMCCASFFLENERHCHGDTENPTALEKAKVSREGQVVFFLPRAYLCSN